MLKPKMINKIKLFPIIITILFLLFLIYLFSAKNYTKEYEIKKVTIKETYNKNNNYYYFTFKYKDITLDMLFESKYKQKRKFIQDISLIEDNNNFCLIPKGDTFSFYPVCYDNSEVVSYNLVNNTLKNKLPKDLFSKPQLITSYKDIDIYNNNHSYYIWNYDGFYYLNNTKNTKIDIFDKEQYTINLIGYTTNYLVIADYDSNYTFNRIYTIELASGHLKKYDLDRDIYFDSYYPGYIKDKIYIIDNKEPAMYEFNAKNGKLEQIPSRIYKNNTWEKRNIKTLIASKEMFIYPTNYHYTLENNNLYLKYQNIKTLISKNVTSIVRYNNDNIYYLKEDELYNYNPQEGETLLLSYFEWNFNSNNMIYIN